jgi:ribonuclease III
LSNASTEAPLESVLGHRFADASLLTLALTHPSFNKTTNNQRLEFLGDSVLGLVVATMLYEAFPTESEGELARRHAGLVRGETLVEIAKTLTLGAHLQLSASEIASGGRDTGSNLEDMVEALIGALYLDGGFIAAEQFVRRHWQVRLESVSSPPKDAKTALQEWAQGRGHPLPAYTSTHTGPAHAPQFTVTVSVHGHPPTTATAASKRAAEQAAAQMLLSTLVK